MTTTTPKSNAGLEGVVAAPSEICFIDGVAGRLVYRGYEIGDLVEQTTFEEVAYLLWNGELPNAAQLAAVRREIGGQHAVPGYAMQILRALPRGTEPMDALRTVVSALGATDPDLNNNTPEGNLRKAVRLTAQLPTVVAAFHRIRSDREVVEADPGLSVAGNFLLMLTGRRPNETLERVMDAALILHAEHGFNASTFAARVTAATLADMHAAVTAAIAALKGPLHGGANQEVMELLLQWRNADEAEAKIRQMLAEKKKVPGFGHRVYKTFDPRATFLRKMSRQLGEAAGNTTWYEMSERLIPVLKDEKNLNPNVDFFSASAYYAMGIPLDLFTPIFAIARVAGWSAHVMEQHRNNRIIRPQDHYLGPMDKKVVAIEQR
jgi:citrate synthase